MPKHFEFVLAAYVIWCAAFVGYLTLLWRKERAARRALERMDRSGGHFGKSGA